MKDFLASATEHLKSSTRNQVRYARLEMERKLKLLDNAALARCLLAAEGFDLKFCDWSCTVALELESARDLAHVHNALSVAPKVTGRAELVEKSRSKVWVYAECEGFPALVIKYKKKIDTADPSTKCKIVKRRETRTYRRLVCEN